MKSLLIILIFLAIGYSSEAQKVNPTAKLSRNTIVKDGILMVVEGIDVSKYEINLEDFDEEFSPEEITKNHLLCLATNNCQEELVIQLVEKGADVNFKCEEVDNVITNLAYCKENGVKLAEIFLRKGADINGADQDNASFLSYSISYDNLKLAEYLIEKGADRMQRDTNRNMGCLPVHSVESVAMLKLLLSKGFEVNQLCNNGRNLLHFAAKDGLKEVAKYLIDNKLVDVNQKDKNGETPLDYAKRFKHPEIAEIINKKK